MDALTVAAAGLAALVILTLVVLFLWVRNPPPASSPPTPSPPEAPVPPPLQTAAPPQPESKVVSSEDAWEEYRLSTIGAPPRASPGGTKERHTVTGAYRPPEGKGEDMFETTPFRGE